jgi:hypothetical protein
MADDRKRRDDQSSGSEREMNDDRTRGGVGDEVSSIADEEEEFEDSEDLDDDEDSDGSF